MASTLCTSSLSFRRTLRNFYTRAKAAPMKSTGNSCLSRPVRISGLILTMYTSCDVFPRKKVPLIWSRVDTAPHIVGEIPQNPHFWGVNTHLNLNEHNIKICILSKLPNPVKFCTLAADYSSSVVKTRV